MESYILGLGTVVWPGILTSISPCPLATNIAAISYIGKRVDSPRSVLWSGLIFTAGRMLTYLLLGIILVVELLIAGILLLGAFNFNFSGSGISETMQKRVESRGIWGAGLLGLIFALSFCPVSAA